MMTRLDFLLRGIRHFAPKEVEATGAELEDVQLNLMLRVESFRRECGRPVYLLKNGLTTGNHVSEYHPAGLAADMIIHDDPLPMTGRQIFQAMLIAGFRGIGVYWNGFKYSVHGDCRPEMGWWGRKKVGAEWVQQDLFSDPKTFS